MFDIRQKDIQQSLYPYLQEVTIQRLRELSGKIWTDFHAHDPGVTLNDVLNYVLTDFEYKLHYNLEDYLNAEKEPFNPEEIGLLSPSAISVSAPIHIKEYEQLFFSQIKGVCRIRMKPSKQPELMGLYDISAQVYSSVPKEDYAKIKEQITELFYRHRNLCEELNKIELTASDCQTERQLDTDISVYLDDGLFDYPEGSFRPIFEHIPARMDMPHIYGVNDWGLSRESSPERIRQAGQLTAYMDIFDELIRSGLEELKDVPRWFRLDTTLARERGFELKKKLLDNLDKIYGENSNPDFMLTDNGKAEEQQAMLIRRTEFLKRVPLWGRDKHKATFLNKDRVYAVESYIRNLLGLTDQEHIHLVEHIFFRHLTEPIRSEGYIPPVFDLELSLTVLVYGDTRRMDNRKFREGLELLIYQRIPAHLDVTVQWLNQDEAKTFEKTYSAYLNGFAERDAEDLKEFIINMRERK